MKKILFLFLLLCQFAQANEHVEYVKAEDIKFELKPKSERQIVFPEPVKMAFRTRYKSMFNHSLVGSSAYITTVKEFAERIIFQGLKTNREYTIMLISSTATSKSGKLFIHYPTEKGVIKNQDASRNIGKRVTADALVQFAAQNIYPLADGVIEPLQGVRKAYFSKKHYPNIYTTGVLRGEVKASWVGHGFYITALKLTNQTSNPQKFDPCNMRGDFHSSTPIFTNIAPKKDIRNNFTAVIVLSEKPFEVAASERVKLCI